MADVIRGRFGARKSGWRKYEAQETGELPDPRDIEPPPDQDRGDSGEDTPDNPTAPPFTGEDVEDMGRPRRRERPPLI
jgi:hypothetical protein